VRVTIIRQPTFYPPSPTQPHHPNGIEKIMNAIKSFALQIAVIVAGLPSLVQSRYQHANRVAAQRGSLTLEQIIWTVAIAGVAIAIAAIVVTNITSKAAELP
jgi:heme/copper-type cytochrome/quinol oxidase subunit 2